MPQKDMSSLLEALKKHSDQGFAPFHMPGHKRNPRFEHLMGVEGLDITEIEGFDNLHDLKGILREVDDKAASVYGVKASRMLVGSATAGILAAVRALTRREDAILIARNCHMSVFHAAELCGLKTAYVLPQWLSDGFYGEVTPQAVQAELERDGNFKLVVITSPTYEGVISDVKGIAQVCRKYGAILLVDEAHGAHLGFAPFEESARTLGADVVVNSLHKTLPSLTQTAVLHVCSDAADVAGIDEQLAVFESSSPSYLLMASMDGCVDFLRNGEEISAWGNAIDELRRSLQGLKSIRLYAGEGAFAYDKSKLVLISRGRMSGPQLMRELRDRFKIEAEMAGVNYVIAMCGAGDTPEMYQRLKDALFELDDENVPSKNGVNATHSEATPLNSAKNENTLRNISGQYRAVGQPVRTLRTMGEPVLDEAGAMRRFELPEKVLEPCEARDRDWQLVPIEEADGRIAAEDIKAYPPGCPVAVKGERLDASTLAKLLRLYECGVSVTGSKGTFPQNVAVLA